jgi:hypothetical protein
MHFRFCPESDGRVQPCTRPLSAAAVAASLLVRKGSLHLEHDAVWQPTQAQLTSFIDFVDRKDQRRFVKRMAEEITMTKERMDHCRLDQRHDQQRSPDHKHDSVSHPIRTKVGLQALRL